MSESKKRKKTEVSMDSANKRPKYSLNQDELNKAQSAIDAINVELYNLAEQILLDQYAISAITEIPYDVFNTTLNQFMENNTAYQCEQIAHILVNVMNNFSKFEKCKSALWIYKQYDDRLNIELK